MQSYRRDIDGLRAVAVISVVLFHAGMPGFGGGFLGVDVFFVISGFLITRILMDEGSKALGIAAFYERRVRRIAPALFAVLIACVAAGLVLVSPGEMKELAKTVIAATFFTANFHFMRGVGYFAPKADASPLVHLWSLSVEEQFYLAYPLFLWAMRRLPKAFLLPTLAAGLAASFAISVWLAARSPDTAFYFTPSRAWEILLGALVALRPLRLPRPGAEALAFLALALIAVPVWLYARDTPWPGFDAAIPTMGTAFLLSLGERTLVGRFLSLKPLTAVGLVSYSLYLWHWPLFEFYRRWVLRPLTPWEYAALIAAAGAVAWLSWRFVEQPFRRMRRGTAMPAVFGAAGLCAALLLCGCAAILAANGLPGRFAAPVRRIYAFMETHSDPEFVRQMGLHTCSFFGSGDAKQVQFETCLAPAPERRSVVLWGDSHSRNYLIGLRDAAKGTNIDILQATFHSCVPALVNARAAPDCTAFNRQMFDRLDGKIAGVVLSARLIEQPQATVSMRDLARAIVAKGIGVIVIGPSLEYRQPVPFYVARYASTGDASLLDSAPRLKPGFDALDEKMRALFAGEPGVTYISVRDTVCRADHCPMITGGAPVQFDEAHLTLQGSVLFGRALWPQVLAALDGQKPQFPNSPPRGR